MTGLVELYEARDGAEPDKAYDAKAAEWRAKLNGLGVPIHPNAPARH
jgi:hypothetical protein